ncbi:MAG TPA: DMT family transporter [Burkholderiales bacterium]|nr:DMT family transporter [Burkholderiales bacterium]
MHPHRAATLSLVAAIATMVVWGANFAVTKYVLGYLGVGPFLFIRFLTMPLLGLALLAIVYRRHFAKSLPRRADWPRFAAAGLIGHTLHVGIVTWGIDLSTAFSSSLVLTSGPLFTLLILVLLGAERLRRWQVAGTLLAAAGIALFLSDKFASGFARAGLGDLVLLFASAMFSIYTVITKPLVDRYGPLPLLAWTLAVGAPPLVLITLPWFLAAPLAGVPAAAWFGMFWAAVISAFVGWLVWVWVNAVRGVARSAPLMYLMPPIAGVVAWLMLGEQFSALKLAGAALTMAGVAWAQYAGRTRANRGQSPFLDPG